MRSCVNVSEVKMSKKDLLFLQLLSTFLIRYYHFQSVATCKIPFILLTSEPRKIWHFYETFKIFDEQLILLVFSLNSAQLLPSRAGRKMAGWTANLPFSIRFCGGKRNERALESLFLNTSDIPLFCFLINSITPSRNGLDYLFLKFRMQFCNGSIYNSE